MSFITDKQTLADLNILGKYVNNSIFSVFNAVVTPGGEKLLDKFFHEPLDSAETINKRSRLFRFFQAGKYQFSIDDKEFLTAERYLSHTDFSNPLTAWFNMLRIYSLNRIGLDREYKMMRVGLEATVNILKQLKDFLKRIEKSKDSNLYADNCSIVNSIMNNKRLEWIDDVASENKLSQFLFAKYDHILRYSLKNEMKKILDIIYDIDVNIAVAKVAEERGFCYAEADEKEKNHLFFENVFHPGVKDAVGNNIRFYKDRNVIFLTGANMAGKSTLMKAIGVAVYLAHMGFPVPADEMKFSVKEGMFTSINVPDDLQMGYSHFYAEVLRVKTVAQAVSSNTHLLIIFDELFKGTNVKDAYDATVAITEAFSKKNNSAFIISTHIMEAGETLKEKIGNMQFLFLPTIMRGKVPIYPYKLQEGITNDRHGMIIINNEKILEIINGKN
ncbi:DNA mismatch repair protein MutS [bioreactor metagenome]|uniref:DNA mismatch repair protein MutS n=1 Tax=bioreactor metagenome TaxID=1076179 RepID=A0A644ZR06_9ZZZZ